MIMKVEDLMIGDWVYFEDKPIKIRNIFEEEINLKFNEFSGLVDDSIHESYISPIPLTSEILKKNGFTKKTQFIDWSEKIIYTINEDFYIIENYFEFDKFTLCKLYKDSDEGTIVIYITRVDNVHELQHALKLCGIDKEIIV